MLADDTADAGAPLLYESLGGARSPPAGAARTGLRFGLSARQWSRADSGGDAAPPERQSSYTDLHALGALTAHRNALGTINVRLWLICAWYVYAGGSFIYPLGCCTWYGVL